MENILFLKFQKFENIVKIFDKFVKILNGHAPNRHLIFDKIM